MRFALVLVGVACCVFGVMGVLEMTSLEMGLGFEMIAIGLMAMHIAQQPPRR